MRKFSFRKVIELTALLTGLATAALLVAYWIVENSVIFTVFISVFTTFYHFAMRLLVGYFVSNRFDPHARWFQQKPFEKTLYRKLGVKKWKDHMPTYAPSFFSLEKNTLEQVAKNMCQAEVVHEVIVVCSFLPLLLVIPWGEFWVFFITSIIAAGYDSIFIMMQRYNRPRIMKLLAYQNRRTKP